jgi:hypothetical protein
VTKLGHPWREFTGIFCKFLEETIAAESPVSVEELKNGTYRVGFDYKTSRYVATVDASKGYTCPLQETYSQQGQLNSRTTATYEQVTDGIWFPVSGQREEYARDGSLRYKSSFKSSQIKINDPAFNASYFDVDMPTGTTVRDEVQRKQYVVGSKRAYDLDEPLDSSAETEAVDPNSWQQKFYSIYRLEEGHVLKRIAPPFIPERRDYFLSVQPGRYSANTPSHVVSQYFNWDGALSIRGARVGSGIPRLESILESVIGLGNREYDLPPDILGADMSGDWIVRKDSPQEELLGALEQLIKDETGRDIDFVKQKVETEVIIAKGKYVFQPLPNITDGKYVLISANKTDTYTGGGGGSGTLDKFLRWVGNRVEMNVVDETQTEGIELSWRNHDSSELSRLKHDTEPYNQKLDLLLNNLARQTGLTFARETATVEKWFLAEAGVIQTGQQTDTPAGKEETLPTQESEPNALPPGWSLDYDDGVMPDGATHWPANMARDLASLRIMLKPYDPFKSSLKGERYEFDILSVESKRIGYVRVEPESELGRILPDDQTLKPGKYLLRYTRRRGTPEDNLRIECGEFPVNLSKPGMYRFQFTPQLGTAEIAGDLGGCYAINFERAGKGFWVRGFGYQSAGKRYLLDGLPPGTYKLSAVTQRQSDNVFVRRAEVTVSTEEKATVNIDSPARGNCSLKGMIRGRHKTYQSLGSTSSGSEGRWFVRIGKLGSGPIGRTEAYEALTMDSLYIVRGRNIVQEAEDQALYSIEGLVPGEYTVTAIEHPWRGGLPVTRQQSKTLVLKDSEQATLDFDLSDIPEDDTPPAAQAESLDESDSSTESQQRESQLAALHLLSGLGYERPEALEQELTPERRQRLLPHLVAGMEDQKVGYRIRFVEVLGYLRERSVVPRLIELLGHDDPTVRAFAPGPCRCWKSWRDGTRQKTTREISTCAATRE